MAGEDKAHCAQLRELPCCRCRARPAGEVHHRTGAGMAMRSHDHEAMPLCSSCHTAFHAASGPFKGWDKARRAEWQDMMVERYRPKL